MLFFEITISSENSRNAGEIWLNVVLRKGDNSSKPDHTLSVQLNKISSNKLYFFGVNIENILFTHFQPSL